MTTGKKLDMATLEKIVDTNDKKRFAFSEDKTKIRASQGHSIDIDLDLQPVKPPSILYHGTATRFLDSIMKTGLQKQNRTHVHLSKDIDTATNVGSRYGKVIVLKIGAGKMNENGYKFYCSENNVWLTYSIPREFISFTDLEKVELLC